MSSETVEFNLVLVIQLGHDPRHIPVPKYCQRAEFRMDTEEFCGIRIGTPAIRFCHQKYEVTSITTGVENSYRAFDVVAPDGSKWRFYTDVPACENPNERSLLFHQGRSWDRNDAIQLMKLGISI